MPTQVVCDGKVECDGWISLIRASGNCECKICGRLYYAHPWCRWSQIQTAACRLEYALHVLCDGTHVKL